MPDQGIHETFAPLQIPVAHPALLAGKTASHSVRLPVFRVTAIGKDTHTGIDKRRRMTFFILARQGQHRPSDRIRADIQSHPQGHSFSLPVLVSNCDFAVEFRFLKG